MWTWISIKLYHHKYYKQLFVTYVFFFKHVQVSQIEWSYIESYLHDKHQQRTVTGDFKN